MAKKKLLLDKELFLEWFYDIDMRKDFFNDNDVMRKLKEDGAFKINAKDLIANCGFISDSVVAEGQDIIYDDLGEVDISAYSSITFG